MAALYATVNLAPDGGPMITIVVGSVALTPNGNKESDSRTFVF